MEPSQETKELIKEYSRLKELAATAYSYEMPVIMERLELFEFYHAYILEKYIMDHNQP